MLETHVKFNGEPGTRPVLDSDWEQIDKFDDARIVWRRRPSRCRTYWDYVVDLSRSYVNG